MTFELSTLLKTTVLLVFASAICFVMRHRASAAARHSIWTIAVWAAIAVPGLSLVIPSFSLRVLPAPQTIASPVPSSEDGERSFPFPAAPHDSTVLSALPDMPPSVLPSDSKSNRMTLSNWMAFLWGLGSFVVVARLLAGTLQVRYLRRNSRPIKNDTWRRVVDDLCVQLDVVKPVDLRIGLESIPPMTWGIFRPVILMPKSASHWSKERRRLVLAHELSHVKRNDGWTQIVAQLACSIYWLNPLIWYASHRMRIERERACDDCVLGLGASAGDYADHLLQIARTLNSGFSFATVAMAHPSQLESRLTSILDPRTRRQKLSRLATGFLVACLLTLTSVAAALQVIALAPVSIAAMTTPLIPLLQTSPVQVAPGTSTTPQRGLASIGGSVTKSGSGEQLPGTRVDLIKSPVGGPSAYTVMTNDEGTFVFSDVQPGEYRILATRSDGLLPAEYGQKSQNVRGLPITLSAGDSLRNVKIAMSPPGSISGRIFDSFGEPVGHAQVQALKTFYRDGVRMMSIAQSVLTNDLGEYRLFWLAPGQYFISASPSDTDLKLAFLYIRRPGDQLIHDETSGPVISRRILENGEIREEVFTPNYYPGTPDVQGATKMEVRAGTNIQGADIRLTAGLPARHIRGVVIDASKGSPAAGAGVVAIPRNSGPSVTIPNGKTDSNGTFDISGVIPGSYYLFAALAGDVQRGGPASRMLVEVAGDDLRNITVSVPPPFDIPGRFVVEGKNDLEITRLRISIRRDPDILGMPFPQQANPAGTPDTSATQLDGSFTLSGIGAGDYRIGVSLNPGMYLKSIGLGSLDVLKDGLHLDTPPQGRLEVVVGISDGGVSGSVLSQKKEPVPNVVVALVPDSTLRYRTDLYKAVGTNISGHFDFKNVAPGNYKLFSWDEVETGAWLDPDYLKAFESLGTPVHIADTGQETTELTVIAARR